MGFGRVRDGRGKGGDEYEDRGSVYLPLWCVSRKRTTCERTRQSSADCSGVGAVVHSGVQSCEVEGFKRS